VPKPTTSRTTFRLVTSLSVWHVSGTFFGLELLSKTSADLNSLYPIGPGVQAWNMNNLAGPAKRAMGIGWMTGVGNMGGITGSFIFIEKEAPKYPTGFGASLGFAAAGVLAALLLEFLLWSINKKNEKLTEADVHNQFSEEELDKMGDKSPLFKYTL
jgi:hypothetical protein